jgi:hypothetical protein
VKRACLCLLLAPLASLGAQAAQVVFPQALQAALDRNRPATLSAASFSCPAPREDLPALAEQLAAANEGAPPPIPLLPAQATPQPLPARSAVVFCAALLYTDLASLEARQAVLAAQQELAARLLEVEGQRVSAEVDAPLALVHARLLRAQTRMAGASLEDAAQLSRRRLATLTGLDPAALQTIADSFPALPETEALPPDGRQLLRRLLDFRDIVQLDYAEACAQRLKAAHDMELGRGSIGELLAAHIEEQRKLAALLAAAQRIRAARLQLLAEAGAFEVWPAAEAASSPASAAAAPEEPAEPGRNVHNPLLAPAPVLLSIMLAPGIESLAVGRSMQFTLIATYSNGQVHNVSVEAVWSLSSETRALLSSTGLLTGLAPGSVTLTASFEGQTQSHQLAILPQPPDEYLNVEPDPAVR